MSVPSIALAGNPNTGKTSLFNRLTGSSARVGNYPGITVECTTGHWKASGRDLEVVDIPGTYSLAARSHEEEIAARAVFGMGVPRPAVVVAVVDATQLVRNLYLVAQLLEARRPVVVALNLIDAARAKKLDVDPARVEKALGVPVVGVSARTGEGLDALFSRVQEVLARPERAVKVPAFEYPAALEKDLARLVKTAPAANPDEARALALWALLSSHEGDEVTAIEPGLLAEVRALRAEAEKAGRDLDAEVISARWKWIDALALEPRGERRSFTARVDRWLLHPVVGTAALLLVLGGIFQALFSWSEPLMNGIERVLELLATGTRAALPPGVLTDLLADGVIGGVGSVVVFLPQIALLFFLLGFLEDSGYLARVAFLSDRLMRAIGLHGRALVPLLSAHACAVPAVLATRTLERRRDRLVVMLVLPFLTCSARLPVYSLVIAAMLPSQAKVLGFVPLQVAAMVVMYLFGATTALAAAAVLGKTVLKGPRVPLLLELPPYRLPRLRVVAHQLWLRVRSFLSQAGSIILVCSVVLWALLYFPAGPALSKELGEKRASASEEELASLEAQYASLRLNQSFAAKAGRGFEPLIAPLGFDWKIGVGLIGAFAAREVFVSTLGVVYGLGGEGDEGGEQLLRDRIKGQKRPDGTPLYPPLVGLSLLAFFALSAQCTSTLAAVKRESGSWKWPALMFGYMTALAWLGSFVIYQGGRLLGLG